MKLIRHIGLPARVKDLCPKPTEKVGVFFALAAAHDLPTWADDQPYLVYADLNHLLKVGDVWIGRAGTDPDWQKVSAVSDLPKFKTGWSDNYEACTTSQFCSPFIPQFFFAPKNGKGFITLKRVVNKIFWK